MKTTIRIAFLSILPFCLLSCMPSSTPVSMTDTFTPVSQMASKTVIVPTMPLSTATLSMTPTLVQIPISTFEASHAVIQTPYPPAQCPPDSASTSLPDMDILNKDQTTYENTILEVLNAGGLQNIIKALSKSNLYTYTRADITHDNVPELIIENRYNIRGYLSVFGCKLGQYEKLLTVNSAYDYTPSVLKIKDMNLNGMPDMVLVETVCSFCLGVRILEWNGQEFQSLLREWMIDPSKNELSYFDIGGIVGIAEAKVVDIDKNGTYEVVVEGGTPNSLGDIYIYGPFRSSTIIYMWDGQYYSKYSDKYSPPEYRFQAIQDGDSAALRGSYEESLAFYQDVIFGDQLQGWSAEERENLIAHADVMYTGSPTPTPLPLHNEDFLQLTAYARYRILLLHAVNGFQNDAQVVYDTLQEKFPVGNVGHPYAEMATAFWDEFLSSKNIGLSCQQAINYAGAHPEILIPLSGPEFGFWSMEYQPFDICPFKNK